ncbi:MAG: glycosyltransferase family 2 protein [Tepidiformaceae bacterium]
MGDEAVALGVSVVIPVHNGTALDSRALGSVFAQTCGPLEVIVVDDGCDDEMGLINHVLKQVVLLRRLHEASLGRQDGGSRVDFTSVLRASLERRRREGLA